MEQTIVSWGWDAPWRCVNVSCPDADNPEAKADLYLQRLIDAYPDNERREWMRRQLAHWLEPEDASL